MKNIWQLLNTILILLIIVFISFSREFGSEAYNECEELRGEIESIKERCDDISELVTKKDTIVVNITNYNRYYNEEKK